MIKGRRFIDWFMDAIVQADEWMDIQMNNPEIKEADEAFYTVLNNLRDSIDEKIWAQLEETALYYVATVSSYAILYGIHVADSIHNYAADPLAYLETTIKSEVGTVISQ